MGWRLGLRPQDWTGAKHGTMIGLNTRFCLRHGLGLTGNDVGTQIKFGLGLKTEPVFTGIRIKAGTETIMTSYENNHRNQHS